MPLEGEEKYIEVCQHTTSFNGTDKLKIRHNSPCKEVSVESSSRFDVTDK
uniref:Uncharacterized protein n=1 Tax=Anguilla anguilla TaxID=7936 RepID=A0A0E9Q3D3_ANGAN